MPGVAEMVVILMILAFVGGWVWSVVDCATKETDEGNQRLIWLVVIVVAGWIGSLIYFLVRRPKRKAELGR